MKLLDSDVYAMAEVLLELILEERAGRCWKVRYVPTPLPSNKQGMQQKNLLQISGPLEARHPSDNASDSSTPQNCYQAMTSLAHPDSRMLHLHLHPERPVVDGDHLRRAAPLPPARKVENLGDRQVQIGPKGPLVSRSGSSRNRPIEHSRGEFAETNLALLGFSYEDILLARDDVDCGALRSWMVSSLGSDRQWREDSGQKSGVWRNVP
jgi:hypothetical protein